MKIILIRHFMTKGNAARRYIGSTDEPLDRDRLPLQSMRNYPPADLVITSTMKRCIETAAYIYPQHIPVKVKHLEECDFGDFENKNHGELMSDPRYQAWIDSGGTLNFPNGESQRGFQERCVCQFDKTIIQLIGQKADRVAFVVHGGTIMAVMAAFGYPRKEFFDRQAANGCGFQTSIDEKLWIQGIKIVKEETEI